MGRHQGKDALGELFEAFADAVVQGAVDYLRQGNKSRGVRGTGRLLPTRTRVQRLPGSVEYIPPPRKRLK
jgi:hypothetical protein